MARLWYARRTIASLLIARASAVRTSTRIERRPGAVHRQVGDVVGRRPVQGQAGVEVGVLQLVGRDRQGDVGGAALEGDQALPRVGLDLEHHPGAGRALAPIPRVARDHDALAAIPAHERERAGPHRVLGEVLAPPRHRGRRHDRHREHRHAGEERREALGDRDPHGQPVHRLDPLDVLVGVGPVAELAEVERVARVALALEAEHHRLGVERRAVVEDHPGPQAEGPDPAAGVDLPRHRQPGLDVGRARPVADQGLEHLRDHLGRLVVGRARRIEGGGVQRPRHHQGPGPTDPIAGLGRPQAELVGLAARERYQGQPGRRLHRPMIAEDRVDRGD
jgi:hypothetical protein